MEAIEIDTKDDNQVRRFLKLPHHLYKNTPQWVPPLAPDARKMLDKQRNPFFRHSEAAFFLAIDDLTTVGRLAVLVNNNYNRFNHENTAFFYLYECEDNLAAVQALFKAASTWARVRGINRILGPRGFSVFDGIGMLVKGFEYRPALGIPYNLPYYPKLIEAVGFEPCEELVSGYLDESIRFPQRIHEIAKMVMDRRGLSIARFGTRRDLKRLAPDLKKLYNDAIQGTPGNVPLTDDEVASLANQLLWFADPKLIKIVMKGTNPVGFLFAYPDISKAIQQVGGSVYPFGWLRLLIELKRTKWININGAGMVEGLRGLGGTAILFSEMFKSIENSRYRYADIVQIGKDNENMQREMKDLGIDFYKTHAIYQRGL